MTWHNAQGHSKEGSGIGIGGARDWPGGPAYQAGLALQPLISPRPSGLYNPVFQSSLWFVRFSSVCLLQESLPGDLECIYLHFHLINSYSFIVWIRTTVPFQNPPLSSGHSSLPYSNEFKFSICNFLPILTFIPPLTSNVFVRQSSKHWATTDGFLFKSLSEQSLHSSEGRCRINRLEM